MQNSADGPTDILMSKGVSKISGQEVPVIQVGIANRIRRVAAADHRVIPAQSESITDVYIERREYDDFSSESEYIVEPTKHFQEEYPLQMATTLVNIYENCTCKDKFIKPIPHFSVHKTRRSASSSRTNRGNSKDISRRRKCKRNW